MFVGRDQNPSGCRGRRRGKGTFFMMSLFRHSVLLSRNTSYGRCLYRSTVFWPFWKALRMQFAIFFFFFLASHCRSSGVFFLYMLPDDFQKTYMLSLILSDSILKHVASKRWTPHLWRCLKYLHHNNGHSWPRENIPMMHVEVKVHCLIFRKSKPANPPCYHIPSLPKSWKASNKWLLRSSPKFKIVVLSHIFHGNRPFFLRTTETPKNFETNYIHLFFRSIDDA